MHDDPFPVDALPDENRPAFFRTLHGQCVDGGLQAGILSASVECNRNHSFLPPPFIQPVFYHKFRRKQNGYILRLQRKKEC